MSGSVYYNEIDRYAAQWLRNLINAGHLPLGDVDERSIVDVRPTDLRGYAQCHFFAGIGGWPYALTLAGWPADRPIWTGSCPCQPLSVAGQQRGHADERHLWPAFYALIAQCKPPTVFGEQVASRDGREWFAGVRADLEAVGYACGGADLCAAGVRAPHIRQRLYWVADSANNVWSDYNGGSRLSEDREVRLSGEAGGSGGVERLAHANGGVASNGNLQRGGEYGQWAQDCGVSGALAHSSVEGSPRSSGSPVTGIRSPTERHPDHLGRLGDADEPGSQGRREYAGEHADQWTPWASGEFIECLDGKARRVEPSVFPLAHGVPSRMGRLRAYGNAIVPQVGAGFVRALLSANE